MIVAVLLAAGLAWWLHRDGVLLPNLRRFGVAAGAAIVAVRLAGTGQPLAALLVAGGGAWWWVASRAQRPPRPIRSDDADARAVLGVAAGADAGAIHAAWRRMIGEVHPDRCGSADLAARVTAARDRLLRR